MDANTAIVIAVNLGGFVATIATLKNDINWLKVVIDEQKKRIEKLEQKLC
ncbi:MULTISPECIES: hypothetical protein [Pseudoalteromonas]|uniref:Uncharacterized protein n=1 Tax=Pseudoalteromonas rhizosphaerae TaxID=2518973 RepID=A0ABW8L2W8_9GAMM